MLTDIWQIVKTRKREERVSGDYSRFLALCTDHKLKNKSEEDKSKLMHQVIDECAREWKERKKLLATTYSFAERSKRKEVGSGQYIFPLDKFPLYWNIRDRP